MERERSSSVTPARPSRPIRATSACSPAGPRWAEPPAEWDCPRCGLPASLDSDNPPPPPKVEPYKTHLAYVKERRSDAAAQTILDEAIATLRAKRKAGEIIF